VSLLHLFLKEISNSKNETRPNVEREDRRYASIAAKECKSVQGMRAGGTVSATYIEPDRVFSIALTFSSGDSWRKQSDLGGGRHQRLVYPGDSSIIRSCPRHNGRRVTKAAKRAGALLKNAGAQASVAINTGDKTKCKVCGGSQICEHNIVRSVCNSVQGMRERQHAHHTCRKSAEDRKYASTTASLSSHYKLVYEFLSLSLSLPL
jgi:hypothetical protein